MKINLTNFNPVAELRKLVEANIEANYVLNQGIWDGITRLMDRSGIQIESREEFITVLGLLHQSNIISVTTHGLPDGRSIVFLRAFNEQ